MAKLAQPRQRHAALQTRTIRRLPIRRALRIGRGLRVRPDLREVVLNEAALGVTVLGRILPIYRISPSVMVHMSFDPAFTGPPEPEQKSGQQKTRPEQRFGRDQSVPGLFSELFNVAASRPAQMTTEHRKISPSPPFRQAEHRVNGAATDLMMFLLSLALHYCAPGH